MHKVHYSPFEEPSLIEIHPFPPLKFEIPPQGAKCLPFENHWYKLYSSVYKAWLSLTEAGALCRRDIPAHYHIKKWTMKGAVKGNKNSVTTRNFIFKVQWIPVPSTCCGRVSACRVVGCWIDPSWFPHCLFLVPAIALQLVYQRVVRTILVGTVHIKEL